MKYITAEGKFRYIAGGRYGKIGDTLEAAHEPARFEPFDPEITARAMESARRWFMTEDEARNYFASAMAETVAAMPAIDALLQEKNICPVVDDRENIKNLIYAETQPLREQLEIARKALDRIRLHNDSYVAHRIAEKALAQIDAEQKGGK